MPFVSIKINASSFSKKFNNSLDSDIFKTAAYKKVAAKFERARNTLLQDFNNHKVTQEILDGPLALNISDTLDGYGNLYSFIGFNSDEENPILSLRDYLEDSMDFIQTRRIGRDWYFRIIYPSKKDIESQTPMPWEEGNSWVEGVEKGITNLSYYMYKNWDGGRSKEGFQLKYENQDDLTFHPTPYLSEIIQAFREKFKE